MCSVSLNYGFDMQQVEDPISPEDRSYELPTGQIIQVNHKQRFKSTEIIFNPDIIDIAKDGVVNMAYKSIEMCDSDLKINLYNNIVLAGGSTLMPGFKERFQDEIIRLAEHSAKTDINVFADLHRKNAAWIGGSMLASFSTFKQMCITRDDYESNPETERSHVILRRSIN